jgi:hypothetical protein
MPVDDGGGARTSCLGFGAVTVLVDGLVLLLGRAAFPELRPFTLSCDRLAAIRSVGEVGEGHLARSSVCGALNMGGVSLGIVAPESVSEMT